MKMLISLEELNNRKSRDKIPLKCLNCGKTHYRTKNTILRILNGGLKGTGKGNCCSHKCNNENKRIRKISPCKRCGKIIERIPSHYNYEKMFCSSSCSAFYNNTHKTIGCRRSKLEAWIESQLKCKYPNVEIHFNRKDTINSELDIYIPSLKLAFELNGIFHYEPIYGQSKFNQIQNNDNRKFQACLEKGIELCIIDTYNVKYLKKERDIKFLNIIVNILDRKLEPLTGI